MQAQQVAEQEQQEQELLTRWDRCVYVCVCVCLCAINGPKVPHYQAPSPSCLPLICSRTIYLTSRFHHSGPEGYGSPFFALQSLEHPSLLRCCGSRIELEARSPVVRPACSQHVLNMWPCSQHVALPALNMCPYSACSQHVVETLLWSSLGICFDLWCACGSWDATQYTVYSIQYATQYTVHSMPHSTQYTVCHTVHSTQYATQYTVYSMPHSTQYRVCHTVYSMPHSKQ